VMPIALQKLVWGSLGVVVGGPQQTPLRLIDANSSLPWLYSGFYTVWDAPLN